MTGRLLLSMTVILAAHLPAAAQQAIDIGSRRELFVDDYLVDSLSGTAAFDLKKPQAREVVLHTDAPWEGNISAYFTIFQDGPLYRMYYRGAHAKRVRGGSTHPEVACYAESKDGIHWTKPKLGLFEFNGSKRNNIVWRGVGTQNFTPFIDRNPDCPPAQRYKAVGGGMREGGLHAFVSQDGLRWKRLQAAPVLPGKGSMLDSQNLAFWDGVRNEYRLYYRINKGNRRISTATSPDFVKWSTGRQLAYPPGTPTEHLYTNAIMPYGRAPHVLIGFPTRYAPRTQQVEPIFMASRDGSTFYRWKEPLIPITAPEDRDGNRSNYMAWGLVQLPDAPKELTVYATEAYYSGPDSRLRRFTYRVDGFVSARAGAEGGELITKPLKVQGDRLHLNFATRAGGSVRIELQDADGAPVKGFTLADSKPLRGDELDVAVAFAGGQLGPLAEKPMRIRFLLKSADVYSFQFQ